MTYRIAIVEDMPRALIALTQELSRFSEIEIVFSAQNGQHYLAQLKELPLERHPQAVLMDIDMPVMNGIDAVRQSSLLYAHIHYIMLTISDEDDKLFNAIQAGAHGYLLKEEPAPVIVNAIKEVIEKQGAPMSPRIARKTLKLLSRPAGQEEKTADPASILSERETEILKGMVDGLDYRQIAQNLFISPHTVRNHISKIYEKLHISSKAQAVKLAIKNKWV